MKKIIILGMVTVLLLSILNTGMSQTESGMPMELYEVDIIDSIDEEGEVFLDHGMFDDMTFEADYTSLME